MGYITRVEGYIPKGWARVRAGGFSIPEKLGRS